MKYQALLLVGWLLLLCTPNVFGWPFDEKLNVYECTTSAAAHACDSTCKNLGMEVEFKVDVKQKIVLSTWYKNGSQASVNSYENCKIIDKKNWVCKDKEVEGMPSIGVQKMGNGVFTSSLVIFPMNKNGKIFNSYSCAK